MNDFVVYGVEIRRDAMGRYSLNDLHRAAGGADKHSLTGGLERRGTQISFQS